MERKTVYGLALIGVAVAAISLLLLGYACPRYNQRAAQMDAIERATVNAVEAAKFLPPGAAVDYLERNYSTLERGRVVHDQLQGERKDYGVLSLLALAGVVGGLAFTIQALRRRL